MPKRNWTRDELIIAFNLYCKIPFGRIHNRNPEIIALAKLIEREPSSVSWKLANFASLDPTLKERNIQGAAHASKLDKAIWGEFSHDWAGLAYESERLVAQMRGIKVEDLVEISEPEPIPVGIERESVVRTRVNQSFFRKAVLAAYDNRCCITGLPIPELLNASHISPWASDLVNRVNPRNGLCLNAIHDRAFDRGLLTVTPEYKIKISRALESECANEAVNDFLWKYDGSSIRLPHRFLPAPLLLESHNLNIFRD